MKKRVGDAFLELLWRVPEVMLTSDKDSIPQAASYGDTWFPLKERLEEGGRWSDYDEAPRHCVCKLTISENLHT